MVNHNIGVVLRPFKAYDALGIVVTIVGKSIADRTQEIRKIPYLRECLNLTYVRIQRRFPRVF